MAFVDSIFYSKFEIPVLLSIQQSKHLDGGICLLPPFMNFVDVRREKCSSTTAVRLVSIQSIYSAIENNGKFASRIANPARHAVKHYTDVSIDMGLSISFSQNW